MNIDELCYRIIGAAMVVHLHFGPGYLEEAVVAIHPSHEAQLVNYLNATGIDDGLSLNFGAVSLQHKHKYRVYNPSGSINPVNPV